MNGPAPTAPPGGESGLVVLVPAAEAVVGTHRGRLDPWAAMGVPAHVTLLSPFVPPESVDDDVLVRVAGVVGAFPRFAFALTEIRWFGDEVVWLAPEPADPFVALTHALSAAFPDHPPYGGVYAEPITHLTLGAYQPVQHLSAAAGAVAPHLPVSTEATTVSLVGRIGDAPFAELHRFDLA